MYKKILFGTEAREKIKKGVNIVADAVSSTLGPRGQNVIFEESSFPTITKDGVTVAQQVMLKDKFENMGNMMAREAAENTNREAGDGTTTTIVLLREIFNAGYNAIAAGINPVLLKRGMEDALAQIDFKSKDVNGKEEQIATISANNDPVIGKLIADVIEKTGKDGIVTVSSSSSLKTEVEYVEGTQIDSGLLSSVFMNDKMTCVLEQPAIIIVPQVITMQSQIVPIIQKLLAKTKTMVLFAEKIEGQALAFLVQNHLQGKFTCVPVKLPSFGKNQEDITYDLAIATGNDVSGKTELEVEDCGYAQRVIIGRSKTIVSGTKGDLSKRIEQVKELIKEEKDLFILDQLKDRLGRLKGSIANISVGGASETDQIEMRYRIEDALNATKSAIEEGIVEGGGVALLRCKIDINGKTPEFRMGQEIVAKALTAPIKKIVENAGGSGEEVLANIGDKGYNALTLQYEDLFKAGIVDPKKVVRNAISNAVATASILLTSNTAIITK